MEPKHQVICNSLFIGEVYNNVPIHMPVFFLSNLITIRTNNNNMLRVDSPPAHC